MKKEGFNKRLAIIISGAVLLVAALVVALVMVIGKNSEQVATYESDINGITMSLTYFAKGDRVYKQTARNVIPYSAIGASSAEEAMEMLEPMIAESQGIDGYSDRIEYTNSEAIEYVTIDYDVVDLDTAKSLVGFFGDDLDGAESISFSKSTAALEDAGFTKISN